MRYSRTLCNLILTGALVAGTVHAANFSFQGAFAQDDYLQFLHLVVGSPTAVTIRTLSYGGGVNSAGATIQPGGFDPVITVFQGLSDPAGLLLATNDNGTCPPGNADPLTGSCWDSIVTIPLTAGEYTVVLSQSANDAFGPFLSDGFSQSGAGNYTGPMFLGMPGAFVDASLSQRTNEWAVDILGVQNAVVIPEPSSLLISLSGLIAAGAAIRFRHSRVSRDFKGRRSR